MWISYSDSEINMFHPICENALNKALERLNLKERYQVLHHKLTGSLEMDFVIQNIQTGKYSCVIEVKRTPSDVYSTRYQYQTMSYVQMNYGITESPFYVLTNLEYCYLFRYDVNKPKVFQQVLEPGLICIAHFDNETKESFINKLSDAFVNILMKFYNNDYKYLVTLDEFAHTMELVKDNSKMWKSYLAFLLYEYIRGAFSFVGRKELSDIRLLHNDIAKICNEGARVNFKSLFEYSNEFFVENINVDSKLLADMYDLGRQNITGEAICSILHQIVAHGYEHDGVVATDLELGRIVAILSKHINGPLKNGEKICDPAAGSGNLISCAIPVYNLRASDIIVNDVNPKLLELLSLRLGLNFAAVINVDNSSKVCNFNLACVDRDFFKDTKVIIMNPPFVAGINCVARKELLYKKLKTLKGEDIATKIGQMPFEAVFLELVLSLVNKGTTIACVFPKTHLTARGVEAQVIRKILLEKFGLELIFTYPNDKLFDGVDKGTCVIVGTVGKHCDIVKVIASYEKIPNLDLERFEHGLSCNLQDEFITIMPGVSGRGIAFDELNMTIADGWRQLNSEIVAAISFVNNVFDKSSQFKKLGLFNYTIKRGKCGNNGASDLLFIDSRSKLYKQIEKMINFKNGMRNARFDSFVLDGGDSKFFDVSGLDETLINKVVDMYLTLTPRDGKQKRFSKSKETLIDILRLESTNSTLANSVLIPRALRTMGKVYLANELVFVSTNFIVCTLPSYKEALLLSSWMSTIFYQLMCEIFSKNQEGMRKMEKEDIMATFVPILNFDNGDDILKDIEKEICDLEFLNLQKPTIRNIDVIWAKYLFGERCSEVLEEARRLLDFLANGRNM